MANLNTYVFDFSDQITAGGRLKRSAQPTAWGGGELTAKAVDK